ncbi:DUF4743 domain-containing protein [Paucibacter sp. JuS9]|uniref:NUDIX hydrolase n=1 Tax=Paucibacter sp. JuS9 TaxID=3228748 RepID=UPI003756E76B
MKAEQRLLLQRCLAGIGEARPAGGHPLLLDDRAIGWLDQPRAALLRSLWPALQLEGKTLRWRSAGRSVDALSDEIGAIAEALRARGEISGWRNERYRCEADARSAARGRALFRLERAAFRFFGLRSRAVHVNGWTTEGRLVCGRRALSKATDPGALDNLAAGGLPADEAVLACARRELWEEAGLAHAQSRHLQWRGLIHARRIEAEGLHDELLHVYTLQLPAAFEPRNRDGEVSEFLSLTPEQLCQRLAEFSPDAAAVVALELLLQGR